MTASKQEVTESESSARVRQAQLEFTDTKRLNWHFVPMERAGLSLKEMQGDQQYQAIGLLNSALSHRGFSKAMQIMALEQILHEMENSSPWRDPDKYHVFIFGEPLFGEILRMTLAPICSNGITKRCRTSRQIAAV